MDLILHDVETNVQGTLNTMGTWFASVSLKLEVANSVFLLPYFPNAATQRSLGATGGAGIGLASATPVMASPFGVQPGRPTFGTSLKQDAPRGVCRRRRTLEGPS